MNTGLWEYIKLFFWDKLSDVRAYLLLEVLFGLVLFSGLALVTLGILRNTTGLITSPSENFREPVRKLKSNPELHRDSPRFKLLERREMEHGSWSIYRWRPPDGDSLKIPLYLPGD